MTSRPDVLPKYPIHGSPIPMTTATHRDAMQSVKSIFLRIRTSCLVRPRVRKKPSWPLYPPGPCLDSLLWHCGRISNRTQCHFCRERMTGWGTPGTEDRPKVWWQVCPIADRNRFEGTCFSRPPLGGTCSSRPPHKTGLSISLRWARQACPSERARTHPVIFP
jgi:hypothetical protein